MKKIVQVEAIAVNTRDAMDMLGVGRNTVIRIGKASGAVIHLGTRKNLYSVQKLRDYIDGLAECEGRDAENLQVNYYRGEG